MPPDERMIAALGPRPRPAARELTAGADHLAVQVLPADPADHLPRSEWRRLAEILGI
ncbi:hypothetical protein [Actinoplanes sp. NPDC026619]|uniref:hypothetical protein n=1 Tax=Actinoplanes sp. NPDC026619 TaxID=3155798 RepID=UPI0033EDDF80